MDNSLNIQPEFRLSLNKLYPKKSINIINFYGYNPKHLNKRSYICGYNLKNYTW